ncbi:hypothetical protein [Sphingobacterium sp. UBA1498]|uniref:hypothetical protein n=1 Tax=Sphingobacterium sp. UBA1498 TaxID=1947481 RepID=UPI0025E5F84A|nr:hypothetical protein [Sphingobacterium sp. UBA1498]
MLKSLTGFSWTKQAEADGELHKDVIIGYYIRPRNADEKTKGTWHPEVKVLGVRRCWDRSGGMYLHCLTSTTDFICKSRYGDSTGCYSDADAGLLSIR